MSVERLGWAAIIGASAVALAAGAFVLVKLNGLDSGQNQAIAAWVQAIGSVCAIAATGWVVQRQHSLERQRRFEQDQSEQRSVLRAAIVLCDHFTSNLGLIGDMPSGSHIFLVPIRDSLAAHRELLKGLPLQHPNGSITAKLLELHGLSNAAIATIELLIAQKLDNADEFKSIADEYIRRIQKARLAFLSLLNKT